ncbi:MAG: N-acetyltransferase [Treponema sp.]|nr:N-acetyltransferase [Treponema sp.]
MLIFLEAEKHMNEIKIRNATSADAERLLEIYAYYVEHTAITFEYDVPTLEEFKTRIQTTLAQFPYLCLVSGENIVGYAYAGIFHEREAYKHSVELSIYIDKNEKKHGFGRALYTALERELQERGIYNLYACIAYPGSDEDEYLTKDSVRFHERLGFSVVGRFTKCGRKFNRWYDMVYMEKLIGSRN